MFVTKGIVTMFKRISLLLATLSTCWFISPSYAVLTNANPAALQNNTLQSAGTQNNYIQNNVQNNVRTNPATGAYRRGYNNRGYNNFNKPYWNQPTYRNRNRGRNTYPGPYRRGYGPGSVGGRGR
jgi:hypothetical protein